MDTLVNECVGAKAQVPFDVTLLESLSSTGNLNGVVNRGEIENLALAPGLNVVGAERLVLKKGATLRIDAQGNEDSVLVLRLESGVKLAEGARIELAGGGMPENVLLYARNGSCSIGFGITGIGTLFCPEGAVRLRVGSEWTGAIAGGASVDLGFNVKLTHAPFLGLAQ
jgi:hypothetical protein